MKKIFFVLAAIVCCMSVNAQVMKVMKGDEVVATYKMSEADKVVLENVSKVMKGDEVVATYTMSEADKVVFVETLASDYEYVDLGLPSGLKWAKMNIGAEAETDFGYYFAWGETDMANKAKYFVDTYKYYKIDEELRGYTKYVKDDIDNYGFAFAFEPDNKFVLDPDDDAAHVNWGRTWHMPAPEDFIELSEMCTWEWEADHNGVSGYNVTGPNGNSIFFPAAGFYYNASLRTNMSYYWANEINDKNSTQAHVISFNAYSVKWNQAYGRVYGCSIRPVCN